MTMTDRELAGCPCCRKPARFSDEYQNADGEWAVECSACNLLSWTVEDWNRRTRSSEGDGRDAERYRWLREYRLPPPGKTQPAAWIEGPGNRHIESDWLTGERADAAIDAAIAAAAGVKES